MSLSPEHALNLLLAAATVAAETESCAQIVLASIEEIDELAMLSADALGVDVTVERQDNASCIYFAPRHQDRAMEMPKDGLGPFHPASEAPTRVTPRRS